MQNAILDIAKELEGSELIDSQLSFRGFINFLKKRIPEEKTMKVKYLDFVVHHFESRLKGRVIIPKEDVGQYEDLLQLVYSTIFPAIEDERNNLWALAVPVKPNIFYGTDSFYDLLRDPATRDIKACMIDKRDRVRNTINFDLVYSIILRQLYNISYAPASTLIRSLLNEGTGIQSFYRLNIDTRFIEVFANGPLPDFDPAKLDPHPGAPENLVYLMKNLPLANFRLEGFSAITVTDITADYVVESIRNIVLNPDRGDNDSHQEEVGRHLKILSGKADLTIGLLPFLKINDRPVFSGDICCHSVIATAAQSDPAAEASYLSMIADYYRDPKLVVFETLPEPETGEPFFLEALRKQGVRSFGLLPVFYNNQAAGVLEVSSGSAGSLDRPLMTKLDLVMPLLAQLLRRTIDSFESRIKSIVKENFTSIQPAVEWKFNEVAWHYERMREQGELPPTLETIFFKEVYPLYGAIDIRNSTIERNAALRKDLQIQFDLLLRTLTDLQEKVPLELVDDLIFQARRWEQSLAGTLTTAAEMALNAFLKEKISLFFSHFRDSRPELAPLIEPYLLAIDEKQGNAFRNRRDLESSIQLINKTINRHLEHAEQDLQKSYPSYFEKFRTDGVEYDIYVGQSISPDKPFDLLYLRNMRLWQLNSMVEIARKTHVLLEQMPDKLATTQLIFVHSGPIDISFRKDERRFDVEGGYNIRYQVVKKRIDKVRILDTNERLTQQGKIAIIYFNDREAEEYAGYIKYLQEKDLLSDETEELELEELQGVSGLRALRVQVKW